MSDQNSMARPTVMDRPPRDSRAERDTLAWSAGLVKRSWQEGDTEPIDLTEVPEFDALDTPVFLDTSGRRRRVFRSTAILAGCAGFAALALLCAALLGVPITPSALFTDHNVTSDTAPIDSPSPPPSVTPNSAGALVPTSTGGTTTTSGSSARAGRSRRAVTSTPSAPRTTRTSRPTDSVAPTKTTHVPPGKPTELPTPPGHTR
jgi:hypothetical protein